MENREQVELPPINVQKLNIDLLQALACDYISTKFKSFSDLTVIDFGGDKGQHEIIFNYHLKSRNYNLSWNIIEEAGWIAKHQIHPKLITPNLGHDNYIRREFKQSDLSTAGIMNFNTKWYSNITFLPFKEADIVIMGSSLQYTGPNWKECLRNLSKFQPHFMFIMNAPICDQKTLVLENNDLRGGDILATTTNGWVFIDYNEFVKYVEFLGYEIIEKIYHRDFPRHRLDQNFIWPNAEEHARNRQINSFFFRKIY